MAVRVGEMWPPQLARQIATIDRLLRRAADGQHHLVRHARRDAGLRAALCAHGRGDADPQDAARRRADSTIDGEFWKLRGRSAAASAPCRARRRCSISAASAPDAREAAAKGCDVFLMWPDTQDEVAAIIADMTRARRRARAHAQIRLPRARDRPRHRGRGAHRRRPAAVEARRRRRRRDPREVARFDRDGRRRAGRTARCRGDDGYAEDNLWTGVGRARSGCGAAIVGDPDQVLAKLQAYRAMGIEAFILSGYPHAAEADLFARHVLPRMTHGPLHA